MVDGFTAGQILRALWPGLARLLVNPLLYAGAALVIWDVWRNARHERAFFGVRVTRRRAHLLLLAGLSLAAGCLMSVWNAVLGARAAPGEVWAVTAAALLLGLIRVRWLSPLYGAAVCAAASAVAGAVGAGSPGPVASGAPGGHPGPGEPWGEALGTAWAAVAGFDAARWAVLLAGAMLCEALLLALFRTRWLRPVYVLSKRGRAIGAFAIHLAFVAPVWIPMAGGMPGNGGLPGALGAGFTALPVLLGFGGLYAGLSTRRVLTVVCVRDLAVAAVLGAGAFAALQTGPVWADAALWAGALGAEAVRLWLDRAEGASDPQYAPALDGVRVLATLPGSLARAMGLAPGEVITHVNQVPVHTGYDLHFAFEQNPAYAKLRVVDRRGEARLVGKPVYDGERVKLGLLLVPDDPNQPCYRPIPGGLLQTVGLRLAAGDRGGQVPADEASGSLTS
jgi:hypothetical protein